MRESPQVCRHTHTSCRPQLLRLAVCHPVCSCYQTPDQATISYHPPTRTTMHGCNIPTRPIRYASMQGYQPRTSSNAHDHSPTRPRACQPYQHTYPCRQPNRHVHTRLQREQRPCIAKPAPTPRCSTRRAFQCATLIHQLVQACPCKELFSRHWGLVQHQCAPHNSQQWTNSSAPRPRQACMAASTKQAQRTHILPVVGHQPQGASSKGPSVSQKQLWYRQASTARWTAAPGPNPPANAGMHIRCSLMITQYKLHPGQWVHQCIQGTCVVTAPPPCHMLCGASSR